MKALSQTLSVILPLYYLVIVLFYSRIFFGRSKKLEEKTTSLLVILLVLHAIFMVLRGMTIGAFTLSTKLDALSFLAFTMIALYLVIELSVKNKATGFYVLTLTFIIQTVSSIFYNWDIVRHPLLSNPIFVVHVLLTILGYAAISASALYSFLYILLNKTIRFQKLGLHYEKLPALSILEEISIRLVRIGIISLGVGILVGHLNAASVLGTYLPMDAKVLFSDLIWLGYFVGYIIAQLNKWRGRWMAYLSMVGFGILIVANITIIFMEGTFHRFQ